MLADALEQALNYFGTNLYRPSQMKKAAVENAEVTTEDREVSELGTAKEIITTLPLSAVSHNYPLKYKVQAFDAQDKRLKVSPLTINTRTGAVSLTRSKLGKLTADKQITYVVKATGTKLDEKNVVLYEHHLSLTVKADGPPVLSDTAASTISVSTEGTGKTVIHTFDAASDSAGDVLKYSFKAVDASGKAVKFLSFNPATRELTLNYTALKTYLKAKKLSAVTLTYAYTATDKKGQSTKAGGTLTLSNQAALSNPALTFVKRLSGSGSRGLVGRSLKASRRR